MDTSADDLLAPVRPAAGNGFIPLLRPSRLNTNDLCRLINGFVLLRRNARNYSVYKIGGQLSVLFQCAEKTKKSKRLFIVYAYVLQKNYLLRRDASLRQLAKKDSFVTMREAILRSMEIYDTLDAALRLGASL